jgi:hypothetical protein
VVGPGLHVAPGRSEEFGAEQLADADHAGDDLGVTVRAEAVADHLVDLGELRIKLGDRAGEAVIRIASAASPPIWMC